MSIPPAWPDVRQLFDAAAGLPAAEREAFVRASAASADLQAEVLSLLAHSTGGGAEDPGFLAQAALAEFGAHTKEEADAVAWPGLRLGAWELIDVLGCGGMGEVWRARRADGAYQGEAAVKLLKRGMDSSAVLQRFAQERQALARLDHPHIARLFDAGLSPSGLPYFVMELVQGRAIDQACEGLSLEARLALFLQLADAVSYAHRHLLVHRDLKPGNVLVNGEGQVKLLDFGIAKALDPQEALPGQQSPTDQTQAGQRPFTPNYASPEQVRGDPVSTATDLYSLGVLLYVMLTGVRPYGRQASTPLQAAHCVLEELPTRPSSLSPELIKDPQWLNRRKRLRGDLDNILLKTLEKQSSARYASVDALAADLRAHLQGYPVSARKPRLGYLLGRFVSRNKWPVAAGSLALAAVVGGAGLALWQARVAQAQSQLAERRFNDVRQFARLMLFEVDTALRDGPTAGREKLVAGALSYLDRLASERLEDRELLRDVAEGYERIGDIFGNSMQANLGRPQEARAAYEKALRMREALAALDPLDLKNVQGLKSINERFGDSARAAGKLPEAKGFYRTAAAHAAKLAQAQPQDLAVQLKRIEADRYLASVDYWPFKESLGLYQPARQRIEALDREMDGLLQRHPERSEVLEAYGGLLNQLSDFQRVAGEFPASLQTQLKSHQLATRLLASAQDNPRWQRWLYLAEGRLADALLETGDTERGLAMWISSIERRERGARADPGNERAQRNLANGYGPLAEALDSLGRPARALVWYQREFKLLSELRQKFPQVKALAPRLDESERDLTLQLSLAGRHGEAVQRWRALTERRAAGGANDDPEGEAKYGLVEARILLAAPAAMLSPAARAAARQAGEAALKTLRASAQREPFNALFAREAHLAEFWLGRALQGPAAHDPAAACALLKSAAAGLARLRTEQRLPANLQALDSQAQSLAQCKADSKG
ncbi:serine/threonine protein kinase [Paucibacter sp. DJ1R-11]|uniref:serine/threonine-protein kinase n=1 Tax=Paucibacter sp. DJ1R-11 TaxID=2893556 RepID=UPI0021E46FAF|nr:serine/threonine-protein kinase [Paucibacter sp. DJ1R-11]MCV2362952.1 serine/threonine protein kinase [Paucibacter sp. DJ1R-11]